MTKQKKKNRYLGPRAKRMKQTGRLQSAKSWLPKFTGANIIKSYRKHFGVDYLCAIRELELLGIPLNQEYVAQLKRTIKDHSQAKMRKKIEKQENLKSYDSDDYYCYIAGYTEGGAAYGIPWESEHLLQQD
jgi:hypothetical protein